MLFHDNPITDASEDLLGRGQLATQIAAAILAWPASEPLVVGLYGAWGDGKTSLLNLIRGQLSPRIPSLLFDPWFFNSQEQLIQAFFQDVFRILGSYLPWHSGYHLRRSARTFAGKLSSVPISLGHGPLSLSLSDITPGVPSPLDLKNALADILAAHAPRLPEKLLVLIDNLDRLPPDEIVLMLKLVRLCADFPRLVYVLAFDPVYVSRAIDQYTSAPGAQPSGELYLKKIVSTDIHLPAINMASLDAFIDQAFDRIAATHKFQWDHDFQSRFPAFYQAALRARCIRNIRDGKRLANAAAFTLPLVLGEVNQADWLVLETVRVFAPSTYQLIRDHIETLCPGYSSLGFRWNAFDRQEWQARFQTVSDTIRPDVKEFSLGALEFLFPVFKAWRVNAQAPSLPLEHAFAEYARQQRIASPDYRHAYLLFGPPAGHLPDRRLTDTIDRINSSDAERTQAVVSQELTSLATDGFLRDFLDKAILRAESFVPAARGPLVTALSEESHRFSGEETFFMDSERARAEALVYALVAQEAGSTPQMLLERAIESASDDAFALDLVVFATPDHNRILTNFDQLSQPDLKAKLKARLHRRYVQAHEDPFLQNPIRFGYLLYQWSGPCLEDRDTVTAVLDASFRRDPSNVGRFLSAYSKPDPLDLARGRPSLDVQKLDAILGTEWLKRYAAAPEVASATAPEHGWALEELRSHLGVSAA